MLKKKSWLYLFLACLVLHPRWGCAEGGSAMGSTIDALEKQLEMGRHEKYIDLRRQPEIFLNDFTSDGCSGGLSVGWEYLAGKIDHFHDIHGTEPAWLSCCTVHDREYHEGGGDVMSEKESFEARKKADLALKECVLETGMTRRLDLSREYGLSVEEVDRLYVVISHLMYRAVRVGGMPCTGLPWRWGYGWPECGGE